MYHSSQLLSFQWIIISGSNTFSYQESLDFSYCSWVSSTLSISGWKLNQNVILSGNKLLFMSNYWMLLQNLVIIFRTFYISSRCALCLCIQHGYGWWTGCVSSSYVHLSLFLLDSKCIDGEIGLIWLIWLLISILIPQASQWPRSLVPPDL